MAGRQAQEWTSPSGGNAFLDALRKTALTHPAVQEAAPVAAAAAAMTRTIPKGASPKHGG